MPADGSTEHREETSLELESYASQRERWPSEGRVILAQYDDEEIVVYQAFHAVTARHAVEHQRLGGPRYSFSRMSWIKPNFLWMMYRCGWLEKEDAQARVLAIWITRAFFDEVLERAVPSGWDRERFATRADWQRAVKSSDVRLQWDPDHAPSGEKEARRAIQLGLRGETLRRFVNEATRKIEDVSDLVIRERENRLKLDRLMTPRERSYEPTAQGSGG